MGTGSEAVDIATERMIEHREQARLDAKATGDLADAADDLEGASGDAGDAIEKEYVPPLESLYDHLVLASTEQRSLSDAMLAATDPVFRAVDAAARYDEALADVEDASNLTSEEQIKLARLSLEAQAAMDAFSADGISTEVDGLASTLEGGKDEAIELLNNLNVLEGMHVRTFIDITETITTIRQERAADDRRYRHSGGRIHEGDLGIVGEGGRPELVRALPGGGIEVTPFGGGASRPGGAGGPGGGGRSLPIVLTIDGRVFAEGVLPHIVDTIELEAGAWRP